MAWRRNIEGQGCETVGAAIMQTLDFPDRWRGLLLPKELTKVPMFRNIRPNNR
jgi:hypothetical protein